MTTNNAPINPGMTEAQAAERDRKRRVLLGSVLMESSFDANAVARLLSDHKNGKPVTTDSAKEFLAAMVRDGLIDRVSTHGKAVYCRKRSKMSSKRWVSRDNGIRLGAYYPC